MMDLIRRVTLDRMTKKNHPDFKAGDTIGVYVKVREGEKERIQLFSGVVIKLNNHSIGKSFTVRKIASGVGVERTFPFASPMIDRIEVISVGKVRRSKLYFLRGLKGRSARLDSEQYVGDQNAPAAAAAEAVPAAAAEAPKAE